MRIDDSRDDESTSARGWAFNLAVFRIALVGGAALPMAWAAMRWAERVLPGVPADAWRPVSFFRWLPAEALQSALLARGAAIALVACLALGFIGLRTRTALGLAAAIAPFALGLSQNQGKIAHDHHLVWFLALLAAGPSGAALSVDARRGRSSGDPRDALRTLRFVWLLMGLLFLGPGLAKLQAAISSGWCEAGSLRGLLRESAVLRRHYAAGGEGGAWTERLPDAAVVAAGALVIALEVGFVFAVLRRRLRAFAAAAGLSFHMATGFALGIWFAFLLPAYTALVDWSALAGRPGLRRRDVVEPSSEAG
ncbi:MAG TPA: hypothetical protein VHF22_01375, partial [Planctomycetota bacterium]|nr:hypothetical protein [Planctomycetota bacterium]